MMKILITILLLISTNLVFADEKATRVIPSTTNFNNNLSTSDTTVQKALDTLDNSTQLKNGSRSFNLDSSGMGQVTSTSTPTISSGCGSGPSINSASSDMAGSLTTGTGVFTSCNLAFGSTHNGSLHCFCNRRNTLAQACVINPTSTTMQMITSTASQIVDWFCIETL